MPTDALSPEVMKLAREALSAYYLANNPQSNMHVDVLLPNWRDGASEAEIQLIEAIARALTADRASCQARVEQLEREILRWKAAASYGDGSPMYTPERLQKSIEKLIESRDRYAALAARSALRK